MIRAGWVVSAAVLLATAACNAQAADASNVSLQNPWQDARLIRWSGEMNAGQFDRVLNEVEADLVSPSPHPFDIDIWCRLHLRQHDLDKAADSIENPALKQALGIAPRIFSLYDASKTGELHRLRQQLSANDIRGSFTYRLLIYNALDTTDFGKGFDLALRALKTQEPNFLTVWLTINLAEGDLRVWRSLEDTLKTDSGFAGTPQGKALAGMLDAEKNENANTSCRDRVANGDRQFVKVADDWLAVYPNDAAALEFRANHEGDLNTDSHALESDIDAALASYPLIHLWAGFEEVLRSDLLDPNGRQDDAGRTLALRWSVFEYSIPMEQQAEALTRLSYVMRGLSGCNVSPRTTTARRWVEEKLSSTPAAYRASLDEELAELDMASAEKPAHVQAVKEARDAMALRKNLNHTTLLIRALEKDGTDAENTEALQLYYAALDGFPDHSEAFYEAGGTVLESLGTCEQRTANWHTALGEFPNATWAMNKLALAESQCAQTQDALKTLATMFEITDPWKGSLATLQTLWAEKDGLASLDAERTQLFGSHPKLFRTMTIPQPVTKVKSAVFEPRQLELVPQTPPVSQLSKMTESADGTLIAVAESDGVVSLWKVNAQLEHQRAGIPVNCETETPASGEGAWCARLLRRFLAHPGQIDNLEFSPDGNYLVTSSGASGTVKVWDVATGNVLWRTDPHQGIRPTFALHAGNDGRNKIAILFRGPDAAPYGTTPVSGWSTLTVCGFDASAPCVAASWYSNSNFGTPDSGALAWSSDGKQLLARVSDLETLILDAGSMRLIKNVPSDKGAVYRPDLSAEFYTSVDDVGAVTLKTRSLDVDAKPLTIVAVKDKPNALQYLPDGAVRFVMQTAPESSSDTADSGNTQASTPATAAIQVIEASSATAKGHSPTKVIASIPAGEYPVPVLRFSSDTPDRVTILSAKPMDPTNPIRAFAVGSLSSAAKGGIELMRLPSKLPPIPNSIAFSNDGRELFVARGSGDETRLDVWDLADEGRPVTLEKKIVNGPTAVVSASRLWTCAETEPSTYGMMAYEVPGLHPVVTGNLPCYRNGSIAAAPGNGTLAWQNAIDSVKVVPARGTAWSTGSLSNSDGLDAIAVKDDTVVAVTEDSLYIQQKDKDTVSVCDTPGASCPNGKEGAFSAIALSTDGHYAAAAIGPDPHFRHTVPAPGAGYGVLVYDLTTGAPRLDAETTQPLQVAVTAVSFLPNSTLYAVGTVMGHVFLSDAANPSFRRAIGTENSPIAAMSFSANGQLLAVALESGAVVLFETSPNGHATELVQLDSFDDGDWSVVDRATQQYDASHAGNLSDLLWVYGNTTIELDQMISNFYRDHLLPKLLAFDPVPARPSPSLDSLHPDHPLNVDLPPSIRIVSENPDLVLTADTSIETLFKERRIRVTVNNSPVDGSAMRIGDDGMLHIAVAQYHTYAPGRTNDVSVYVDNNASTIEGRGIKIEVPDRNIQAANQVKPQFYAIIAGISDYTTPDLRRLPLADADARAMVLAVARGAAHLTGDPSFVHITLLTTDKQEASQTQSELRNMGLPDANVIWMVPTHANFLSAFQRLKASHLGADDVFLMFLAGHGMTVGKGSDKSYAYPTQEMADVNNPAVGTYLSQSELEDGVTGVAASHTVLLFDTCDSGSIKIDSSWANTKFSTLSHNFENSIDVLMGAAADTSAYDDPQIGHGFLTNSLLASMRENLIGNDLLAKDWLDGAWERTVEIARSFGYHQRPVILDQAGSLDVAKLPRTELDCIPDVEVVPLVDKPQFRPAAGGDDTSQLRLSNEVANHWIREAKKDEGATKPSVFYDDGTSDEPHIHLTGDYSTSKDQFTMDMEIHFQGSVSKVSVLVPLQSGADSANLNAVVQTIVQKVEDYARSVTAARKPWTPPSTCFTRLAMMN